MVERLDEDNLETRNVKDCKLSFKVRLRSFNTVNEMLYIKTFFLFILWIYIFFKAKIEGSR